MTIAEEKQAQRAAGRAARKALDAPQRTAANAALCRRVLELDAYRTANTLLLYAAFGGEADLAAVATVAARQGKTVAYPVCGKGFTLLERGTFELPFFDPQSKQCKMPYIFSNLFLAIYFLRSSAPITGYSVNPDTTSLAWSDSSDFFSRSNLGASFS